jgi:Tol biopolymer transport system component
MKFGHHVSWFLLLVLCVACQGTSSPRPTIIALGTETAAAQPSQANPSAAPTDIPSPTASATDTPLAPTPTQEIHLTGRIAFYSDRDGNPEIYTIQAGGSQPRRLTNEPAFDDSPSLSPDGRQIVFLTARHDPNPRFPNLKYEIYVMNVDGSNPRRLTNTEAAEDHPAWSPDGSKILFDADYDGDGFYEIYTMNPDGTGVARLTSNAANDQFADWSPDGAQIAFSSDRNGNWDVFIMDADGANQRPLTSSPNWELFPVWSPDGSLIAFNVVVSRPGNTDIFLMNADGSDLRQLTNTPGYDENPAWSPDGSQIIFQTRRDGHFELYVMSVDGSQQRPLAISPADELWPSWGLAAPLLSLEKSSQALGMRETYQVAIGDLDGDGDLDAVFANPMGNPAEVWLNDGNGTLADTGQQLTQYGHGVGLADFDEDGDLDAFIVCHQFSLPSKVYLNDGSGLFTATGQDLGDARLSAADVNLLDVNGDGYVDAHVLYYSPSGIPDKVFLNDGQATFHDSGLALDEDLIAWGDLDADGDTDYFGKHWGQGYVAMLNDGTGQFTEYWQMEDSQATVGDIALADFDADGDLDALIANGFRDTGSFPSRYLWNDGNGQFTDSGQTLFETLGASLAVGDLDLDGDLDVFIANMDRPNEVWLYQDGAFTDSGLRLGNASEMSGRATLADLDGDGDLDVVVGRFRGGAEVWFTLTQGNEKGAP